MIVVGFGALSWGITSLYLREYLDFVDVIGQILLTIAFYPVITWVLGLIRKAIG